MTIYHFQTPRANSADQHSANFTKRAAGTRAARAPGGPLPKGFNPDECPILSLHWFGLQPCPQANDRPPTVVGPVADLGVVRLGAALHRPGISIGVNIGTQRNVIEALGQRVQPSGHQPARQNVIEIEGVRR